MCIYGTTYSGATDRVGRGAAAATAAGAAVCLLWLYIYIYLYILFLYIHIKLQVFSISNKCKTLFLNMFIYTENVTGSRFKNQLTIYLANHKKNAKMHVPKSYFPPKTKCSENKTFIRIIVFCSCLWPAFGGPKLLICIYIYIYIYICMYINSCCFVVSCVFFLPI